MTNKLEIKNLQNKIDKIKKFFYMVLVKFFNQYIMI